MAMLPLYFLSNSHCLGCGDIEYSKLVAPAQFNYSKRTPNTLRKIDFVKKSSCRGFVHIGSNGSLRSRDRLKVFAVTDVSVVQTVRKVSTYTFRTEIGSLLRVFVERENNKYRVHVELLSPQLPGREGPVVLSWGLYRSDSSSFMHLDFGSSGNSSTTETTFVQESPDRFAVKLDFEASLAPFYISFLLKFPSNSDSRSAAIRSHRKTSFVVPVGLSSGHPAPLGLSFLADGCANFALVSRSAESVYLCLYDGSTAEEPSLEIDLDPYINRTGNVWHAAIDTDLQFVSYGYRCKMSSLAKGEQVLLDPYAKVLQSFPSALHGSISSVKYLGQLVKEPSFDWSNDSSPCLPMEKLFVYRLNVMDFTKDNSSKLLDDIAGTFSGITEKLYHLKDLGVNAILLEPIFPFDESRGPYFPLHFFSPRTLYGPSRDSMSAIKSMKDMVKKLHASGMEVFLEVVYTHTAENAPLNKIDNSSYYYANDIEGLESKNALNCNYPVVQQMILDSLRYWVIEFHIDGFCFINASMLRGSSGEYLSRPPLVEAIAFDPIPKNVKVIADFLNPCCMESEEIRFPHWKRWAEMNTKFCDDARNFLRGKGLLSSLATRLCGSGDIFLSGRGPAFSFNYIARNTGLPLVDLVSFSCSELASELSWNCGEEGPTNNAVVLERRLNQIRNFLFILFMSLGVPVLNMGDECGQSSGGSPAYGVRKPFNWDMLKTGYGIQTTQFISFLSSLRIRRSDLLQRKHFMREENIEWHGSDGSPPRWDDPCSRFLAMTLKTDAEEKFRPDSSGVGGDLFAAFNGGEDPVNVILPPPAEKMTWYRLVDTALPYPGFFTEDGVPVEDALEPYEMKAHTCVLFEARRESE